MDQNNPQKKRSCTKIGCASLFALVVIALIISVSSNQNSKTQTSINPTITIPNDQQTYNLASLIGKNYNEMQAKLGKPTNETLSTEEQLMAGIPSDARWELGTVNLLVDFKTNTEPINYFFLGSATDLSYTKEQLIKIGELSDSDNTYRIIPQPKIKGVGLTGIHICATGFKNEFCH